MSHLHTPDTLRLAGVVAWLREGSRYFAAEDLAPLHEKAVAHLAAEQTAITDALAQLQGDAPLASPRPVATRKERPPLSGHKPTSTATAILRALTGKTAMTSAQVLEAVRVTIPEATPNLVASALHRLCAANGSLRKVGSRGTYSYALKDQTAHAETA